MIRIHRNGSSKDEECVKAIHELFHHHRNHKTEHCRIRSLILEQTHIRNWERCCIRIHPPTSVEFVQQSHELAGDRFRNHKMSCFRKFRIPGFQLGYPIR